MIFVTVGQYLPFDRLTKTVDKWAMLRDYTDIFAQIGRTAWSPRHMKWARFIKPEEFEQKMKEATTIVAHAGAGTILKALELGKPVLVMPRFVKFHETNTEHQLYMAERFQDLGLATVAIDENDLMVKLDRLHELRAPAPIPTIASSRLIQVIHDFVNLRDP